MLYFEKLLCFTKSLYMLRKSRKSSLDRTLVNGSTVKCEAMSAWFSFKSSGSSIILVDQNLKKCLHE